ncbi:MAG: hypothetical protein ACSHX0_09880 [Akkermansiaceae bacterium]
MVIIPNIFRAFLCSTVFLTTFVSSGQADELELLDVDRIALLEKLEKLQEASNLRISGLYKRAIQDYRSAVQSDTKTMDLYLRCVERVRFEEKYRSAAEFREWKRNKDDELGSKSFRMALRHQLLWLLLSIEAASNDGDVSEMGVKAVNHLNQIFDNARVLMENHSILEENALNSVFAQAYELNIEIENWPQSGLDIDSIYEQLVFPPLATKSKINEFRAAWQNKINHTGFKIEKWSGLKTVRERGDARSTEIDRDANKAAMDEFLSETRPALQWEMEVACYELGDEKKSALNMIRHLEQYMTHQDAPQWLSEFHELIAIEEQLDLDEIGSVGK